MLFEFLIEKISRFAARGSRSPLKQ